MSAVEHHGGLSHRPDASHRSASAGHTPHGHRAGTAGSFSEAAATAMRRFSGHAVGHHAASSVAAHADPAAAASAGSGSASIAAAYSHYLGRRVGSGQCVALVYATTPGIGSTRCWSCGEPVQGNTRLQPGTVIATFDRCGRYANATDGSSHAAIYLGQNEHGIQVLDQWAGSPAAVRTIRWSNPGGTAANTGTAFRVVRTS